MLRPNHLERVRTERERNGSDASVMTRGARSESVRHIARQHGPLRSARGVVLSGLGRETLGPERLVSRRPYEHGRSANYFPEIIPATSKSDNQSQVGESRSTKWRGTSWNTAMAETLIDV